MWHFMFFVHFYKLYLCYNISVLCFYLEKDEDTESLLEYHGFTVKEFEEQYIVKEGPFCNSDSDYPTKASKLVHMKKSGSIIDDVSSTSQAITLPSEDANELHLAKVHKKHEIPAIRSVDKVTDEEMPDFQSVSPPKEGSRTSFTGLINKDNPQVAKVNFPPWDFSVVDRPPEPLPAEIGNVRKPIYESSFKNLSSDKKAVPLETESRREQQVRPVIFQFDYPVQNVTPQSEVAKDVGGVEPSDFHQEVDSEEVVSSYHEKEAAEAKLKLTFRSVVSSTDFSFYRIDVFMLLLMFMFLRFFPNQDMEETCYEEKGVAGAKAVSCKCCVEFYIIGSTYSV